MTSPTSPIPQSILLLGAGELGTAILHQLAKHPALSGARFTVALRPSTVADPSSDRLVNMRSMVEPTTRLSFAGLDLGAADAKDSLIRTIRDAKAELVITCTGFTGLSKGVQVLIAEAVLESGVVRRYFPWQWGGDYDIIGPKFAGGLMEEHCAVRDVLRERAEAAGVEWTIVSAGIFMSFVFEDWIGVVEGLGQALKTGKREALGKKVVVRGFGTWENTLTLTDVQDIGKVTADLVVHPPEERNDQGGSVVYASGQTLTYKELADVIESVVGPKTEVVREEWTVEYLKAQLEKDPENPLKKYQLLFGNTAGASWPKEKTINSQRRIETIGVEQWLREKLRV